MHVSLQRECAAKAKECFNNTGGDACKKVACVKAFGECLKANKPTNLPTSRPDVVSALSFYVVVGIS